MSKESALSKKMIKLVKSYQESGESQKVFALSQGLSKGKLNYWIKKLSEASKISTPSEVSSFMPIELTALSKGKTDKNIIIRLGNGIEIEIPI